MDYAPENCISFWDVPKFLNIWIYLPFTKLICLLEEEEQLMGLQWHIRLILENQCFLSLMVLLQVKKWTYFLYCKRFLSTIFGISGSVLVAFPSCAVQNFIYAKTHFFISGREKTSWEKNIRVQQIIAFLLAEFSGPNLVIEYHLLLTWS